MTVTMHTDAEVARAWTCWTSSTPSCRTTRASLAPAPPRSGRPAGSHLTDPEHRAGSARRRPRLGGGRRRHGRHGQRPGDRDFAAGVAAWLFWFVGLEPLPRWLR